jgi:CDP-diacylglycerol--serine O-phosphatidyltransferase
MTERMSVRRTVLTLPNGLTLANLFFGIFAIVASSRGELPHAAWYIILAGVCDSLDGRVARATRTGSRFGEELDSLVDAISFGLAPGLMMYFAALSHEGSDWMIVFLYVACVVIRLARFNVEQAGRAKKQFVGLPSPAAGGTLATYFMFSHTPLYNQTFLGTLPWQTLLIFLMAALGMLMISDVPYPAWPTFSLRTVRGSIGLVLFIGVLGGLIALPNHFFFPAGMAYVLYGPVRALILGLLERGDERQEDEDAQDIFSEEVVPLTPRHTRRLHGRPGRHTRPQGPDANAE